MSLLICKRLFGASEVSTLDSSFVAAFVALALTAAGCSRPCKKFYDMNAKCRDGKDGSGKAVLEKESFFEMCDKHSKVWKRYLDCTKHTGCERFRKCVEREAKREKEALDELFREDEARSRADEKKRVADLIAKKDWNQLVRLYCEKDKVTAIERKRCTTYRANFAKTALANSATDVQLETVLSSCSRWLGWTDVQIQRSGGVRSANTRDGQVRWICDSVLRVRFRRLLFEGIQVRDKGPYQDAVSLAGRLEHTAGILRLDQLKKVKDLCSDLRIAGSVHLALKAVKQMQRSGKAFVPFHCRRSLDQIGITQTAFARKAKAVLLKACYITLGKLVLEKMLEERIVSCGSYDREVYNAVEKHQLKDPSIDPLIAKAKKYCAKKP